MNRLKLLFAIFIITFSTILIEVAYTRIFSVVYYGHFAFFIISLALFGYGLSGVYLAVSKLGRREDAISYLDRFFLLFCLSIPVAYKISLIFVIDFLNLFNPLINLVFLVINFLAILVMFFFAGVLLALIFSNYSEQIGRLYFIDLVGAGLGSLAVVPMIPFFGPSRTILVMFLALALVWFWISQMKIGKRSALLLLMVAIFVVGVRFESKRFQIIPGMSKRMYMKHLENNRIEYSKWSTINKIDVAQPVVKFPPHKIVWINGGTQQSQIRQMPRNFEKRILWDISSLPYQMHPKGSAVIIGSAGGWEVLVAASHEYAPIVAIEMDPVICDIVRNRYADYGGNVFQRPNVTLLADEGRSALKRLKRTFDVIQMVNSHNTDMLLSGGMSISESYIYTVESFKEYWDKLNPDGLIYIVHPFGERLFSTALQALREMQVPHPENKFFIFQNPNGFNFFLLKKGDFNRQEEELVNLYIEKTGSNKVVMFSPFTQPPGNTYTRTVQEGGAFLRTSSVNIMPVYDHSPYFNLPNKIGQFSFSNIFIEGMGRNLLRINLVYSNSIYLSILGLSILFSILFIFIPLSRKSEGRAHGPMIGYFFLIGLAFIMVEIIYIKIFQLFLGNPAFSISAIMFSILVASGLGSLSSGVLEKRFGSKLIYFLAIFLAAILVVYSRLLFPILNSLIDLQLPGRLAVTFLLVALSSFAMGMFFPYGIRNLGHRDRRLIGWAWGANAFATVLGSILAVIVSVSSDFGMVLLCAGLCYLLAGAAWWWESRKNA
jgi:spermidine synthase